LQYTAIRLEEKIADIKQKLAYLRGETHALLDIKKMELVEKKKLLIQNMDKQINIIKDRDGKSSISRASGAKSNKSKREVLSAEQNALIRK
jgi:hypothetical protein